LIGEYFSPQKPMDKASRFSELIRQQQESGLSIKDFCYNQGISHSTFHYWYKKLRNSKREFIPLIVKPPVGALPDKDSSGSRRSGNYPATDEDQVLLELIYPNGTHLRIKQDLDLEHLRALIHLYD